MIGKFLGHRQVQTTARYAHLARNSVKTDAVRISDSLEADMNTPPDYSLWLASVAVHSTHRGVRLSTVIVPLLRQ